MGQLFERWVDEVWRWEIFNDILCGFALLCDAGKRQIVNLKVECSEAVTCSNDTENPTGIGVMTVHFELLPAFSVSLYNGSPGETVVFDRPCTPVVSTLFTRERLHSVVAGQGIV